MYKSVRKKVAGSLSKVELPEHFDWNKWLRVPLSEDYYIEPIYKNILDTNDIILEFIIPTEKGFTFDLPRIKISKAFKQLTIQKHKTSKIFFSFPSSLVSPVKEILPSPEIMYSLSVSKTNKGSVNNKHEGQNKEIWDTITEVSSFEPHFKSVHIHKFPLLLPSEKVSVRDVSLNIKTEVFDLLSNLKTEVINVKLLNTDTFVDPIKFSESRKIELQILTKAASVKKIDVVNLDKLLLSLNEQKKLVQKINFQELSSKQIPTVSEIILPGVVKNMLKVMSVKNIKIAPAKLRKETKIDDKIKSEIKEFSFPEKSEGAKSGILKDLEVILQPVLKFGKEDKEIFYSFLFDYQKPAADYLSENKVALLNDQLGTGKTCEAIAALRILFHKKDISEAIIVSSEAEMGWIKRPSELKNEFLTGWYDHLREFLPGVSCGIIEDNNESEWKKPLAVRILSYRMFSEAIEKKLISFNELNRRGCLIIDEVEDFPEIIFDVLPKFLWMLSDISGNEIKDKVSAITGGELFEGFGRTKSELTESLPGRIRQDYWIEMEPEQRKEYNKALETGRERIYDLVQAGNPFLVQSNVFTLVHQLTQIGNFYGEKDNSPKSELLLHQLKTIQKTGKKAVVLTQYDRQGTQRLEKLFAQNGIKYVLYQTGVSLKEMEEAVKKFTKNKSISVFLAGMKAISSKVNFDNVHYLIHFDQWWSPVTTWQAEDKINAGAAGEGLNIYNYLIRNSIEDKIRIKLTEKGLLNKNLFELLNSEVFYSLLSNEDWLELLDLIEPAADDSIRKIKDEHLQYVLKLSTEDFAHKIKALVGRLGYKNISFKTSHNADEIRLYAVAVRNSVEVKTAVQCLNMKIVTKKVVKEFIDSIVSGTDKILIFTSGEFDKKIEKGFDTEKIEFIDKHRISDYLDIFNLI